MVQCPKKNEQPFKFIASNSAQKAQYWKRSWSRLCSNERNGDDLANFCPITIKSFFIMATPRYDCAILVNENCFGRGPNSAISVRLCPLCHGGSSERLVGYWGRIRDRKSKRLPNVYDQCAVAAARTLGIFRITTDKKHWPYYRLKNCLNFTFLHIVPSGSLISRHRKFQRLLIVFGHWNVTAGPKCMICHIFKRKVIQLHS